MSDPMNDPTNDPMRSASRGADQGNHQHQAAEGRFVLLFGLALLLHIGIPLLQDVRILSAVVGLGYIGVLGYAGWVTIASRRGRMVFALTLMLSLATTVALSFDQSATIYLLWLMAHLGFFSYVTGRVIHWTIVRERVTVDTIFAALSGYYLFGFAWSLLYCLVDSVQPGSFNVALGHSLSDSLYFSFVTLTTLGYGDINPVAQLSRALATTEALVGQLYMAVLIARLVSQYIVHSKSGPPN